MVYYGEGLLFGELRGDVLEVIYIDCFVPIASGLAMIVEATKCKQNLTGQRIIMSAGNEE